MVALLVLNGRIEDNEEKPNPHHEGRRRLIPGTKPIHA
jgi:hypothetical protein